MTIGKRISELRKKKGYTQEYIAEQLGVSRQAVSKWEQEQASPDTKNLIALAKLLDASVEYIATGFVPQKAKPDTTVVRALYALSKAAFLLAVIVHFYGTFSGMYNRMFQIGGLGIMPLYYGTSPLAMVFTTVSVISLIVGVILAIVGYHVNKKNK